MGRCWSMIAVTLIVAGVLPAVAAEPGLVGYWPLRGDCDDHSGKGRHAINHGVDVNTGEFDGRTGWLEIPASEALQFGTGDFSVTAYVKLDEPLTDVAGDIVSKFDPASRRGFSLTISAGSSGYNSIGSDRRLQFWIDSATEPAWTDCGRPNPATHNSDAPTVFRGELYVGTTDGVEETAWAHVYRYAGEQQWEDCGRVGNGRTRGVYAMIVHAGELYAATAASHGKQPPTMDFGRVYRYRGDHDWEDLGEPGPYQRLHSLGSFGGKLYVAAFNINPEQPGQVYVYEGERVWRSCGEFPGYPHTLMVHDGRLYTGYPRGSIYEYDGGAWTDLGNPLGSREACSQIHSQGVCRGELFVGTWPLGKVAVRRAGNWIDTGRLSDATEVTALTMYHGGFYAGTIPRAEVLRYDGDGDWQPVRRLFDPPGFEPVPVGSGDPAVADWSRASGMAVYDGQLFVTTATCYRTRIENPLPDDIRGKVFAMRTGASVSHDRDLGDGWKHVAAVRCGSTLELFIDGTRVSLVKNVEPLDVATDAPLQIGLGPQSHFHGRIRDVRLYDRALSGEEVAAMHGRSARQMP